MSKHVRMSDEIAKELVKTITNLNGTCVPMKRQRK